MLAKQCKDGDVIIYKGDELIIGKGNKHFTPVYENKKDYVNKQHVGFLGIKAEVEVLRNLHDSNEG